MYGLSERDVLDPLARRLDRRLAERRVWLVGWETTCEGQSDDYQEGERARKDVLHTRHKSWTKDSSQGPLWAEADKLR